MLLTKAQKSEIVGDLSNRLGTINTVLLLDYQGLKVKDIQEVRKKLRAKQIDFKVVKNTLFKIALDKNNESIPADILKKPLAVAFYKENDEIDLCQTFMGFTKEMEALKIVGGIINKNYITKEDVKFLANLPTKQQLYAQLVGTCAAPLRNFVTVLQGNLRGLVTVLKRIEESK